MSNRITIALIASTGNVVEPIAELTDNGDRTLSLNITPIDEPQARKALGQYAQIIARAIQADPDSSEGLYQFKNLEEFNRQIQEQGSAR